jgi:O-antigen/teichoic acid export membrane protein
VTTPDTPPDHIGNKGPTGNTGPRVITGLLNNSGLLGTEAPSDHDCTAGNSHPDTSPASSNGSSSGSRGSHSNGGHSGSVSTADAGPGGGSSAAGAGPRSGSDGGRRQVGGLAGGVTLGLASGLATALGYLFTAVLARSFTASDYGALVALLGAGLIGTIPAAGLQYVVARRTVALALPPGRNDGPSLGLSALAGIGLLVVGVAVAVPARSWLHLDGVQPMIALAVSLIPLTLAGTFQGALLGHRRFAALGGLYVVAALTRLGAGAATALAGWGVSGAFWALAVAAALSTGVGWLLTGPRSWHPAGAGTGALTREVLQACSTVAGILVLTNTDVLLARHYLDAETSGAYGVASLFAKAILWGSQFVVQAAYPALAAAEGRRRLLLRTLAATAGLGLIGIAGTAVLGHQLVKVATGSGYGVSTGILVAFALLGTVWAVTQVLLLAAVAVGDRRPSRLLWGLIAVEAVVVAVGPHRSAAEILAVCTVAVLLFALLIGTLEWTRPAGAPAGDPPAGPR